MSDPDKSEELVVAERLKAEGNAFYVKRDFGNARGRYTAALEKDPRNATLYSNRAAAYLGENQYLDAAWDCYEAVRLDPEFTKAWGRLGNAALVRDILRILDGQLVTTSLKSLKSWDLSITAFEKGLATLPSDESEMSVSQKDIKAQLEQGVAKAKVSRELPPKPIAQKGRDSASRWRPWERAADLIRTKRLPNTSSAFIMREAAIDYEDGLRALKAMRIIRTAEGEGTVGSTGATVEMTNGILCDERVFHIDSTTIHAIGPQSQHENGSRRGWAHIQDIERIKQEAIRRLASEGWDGLRLAFATTVRLRIFHAFLNTRKQAESHEESSYREYSEAIELLEWGRQRWDGVGRDDRGPVFEKTFIRGVKRLKLQHMTKVLDGPDAEKAQRLSFTDEDAAQLAQDLIADVDADPIPTGPMWDDNPGQYLAWWRYVKGCSLGVLAWYHRRKGSYRLASEYYDKAALEFPEDDEYHPLMLRSSMECALQANAPFKEALQHFKRVRHAIPKVLEVWQGSISEPILVHDSQDIPGIETEELYNLLQGRRTIDDI